MANASTCSDEQQLRRLAMGPASAEECESFALHLEQCAPCAGRLEKLQNESQLVDALRCAAQQPLPLDHGMLAMIEHWQQRAVDFHRLANSHVTLNSGTDQQTVSTQPRNIIKEFAPYLGPPRTDEELGWLGTYRLLEVLGYGGMGVVFRAEDTVLHRPVALKLMHPSLMASSIHRQRFLREVQSVAGFQHDHVVRIYHAGEEKGVAFLAMELLRGQSLDALLQQGRPIPMQELLRLGLQIAEGLAAVHESGLTHRDIKPSNIWLEEAAAGMPSDKGADGSQEVATTIIPRLPRAKILDFGLAHSTGGNGELTLDGMVLGTPAYMAPERADGARCDARSDLFSLGCVLYRMGADRVPFGGTTPLQQLRAVMFDQARPLSQEKPEIPEALSSLVMRLLAKNPAERPTSAREVIAALQAVSQGPLAGPRKEPSLPPSRPTFFRRRKLLALAALVLVVLTGGWALWPRPTAQTRSPYLNTYRVGESVYTWVNGRLFQDGNFLANNVIAVEHIEQRNVPAPFRDQLYYLVGPDLYLAGHAKPVRPGVVSITKMPLHGGGSLLYFLQNDCLLGIEYYYSPEEKTYKLGQGALACNVGSCAMAANGDLSFVLNTLHLPSPSAGRQYRAPIKVPMPKDYPPDLYRYTRASGDFLPADLALDPEGEFHGKPTRAGTYRFSVLCTHKRSSGRFGVWPCELTVNPGPAARFIIDAPSAATVGERFTVNITAKDAHGNTATGYRGKVKLTTTNIHCVTFDDVELTSGYGSINLTLKHAGSPTALCAYVGSLKGACSMTINPDR